METQRPPIANRHGQCAYTFSAIAASLFILLLLTPSAAPTAWAQTFSVLYSFSGGAGGQYPFAGVTIGDHGNLYGTTTYTQGQYGAVYQLEHRGSGWVLNPLLTFNGYNGYLPNAGVVFGPDGRLYGATMDGGDRGLGIVFDVRPQTAICHGVSCPWHEDVLHAFQGGSDGDAPGYGDVIFDSAGNIYGTTLAGGENNFGSVYELSPSGGQWIATTLYMFTGGPNDGDSPYGGVIFDAAGNLYGTTSGGGLNDRGTVYELTRRGDVWTENILYNFNPGDSGEYPADTLVMDASGNLYGTTLNGGGSGGGTVFELSRSGQVWIFSVLYSFTACTSYTGLTIDSSGDLYGTCPHGGAHGAGMIYKLTNSGGSWTLHDLYDFTGGADGALPEGVVVLDSSGNIFGTAEFGGVSDGGTVWEITGGARHNWRVEKP